MPPYLTSSNPFNPPPTTLQRGKPGYSWGGFNDQSAPSQMIVLADEIVSNVATLSVQLYGGDPPAVGSLIYVQGTLNVNTGSPPIEYNVTGAVVTASNFLAGSPPIETETGLVSFALTANNVSWAKDFGIAVVPTPETSETVLSTNVGKAFGVPQTSAGRSGGDAISWSYSFPGTAPATATTYLQGADIDVDSNYSTLDSGTLTATETRPPLSTSGLTGVNFLRIKTVFTKTNTSDVISLVAKIVA
jgi:hypothetical protein